MSKLDIRRQVPTSGKPVYKHEYERTSFDYTIIVLAYLFAPLGFVLALIRLLTTHSKNQRKASNYNLFYHVCMGAFMELGIGLILIKIMGEVSMVRLLIGLVIIYILFRIPANKFAVQAEARKAGFTYLCNDYIALVLVDGIRHIGSLSDIRGYSEKDVRRDLEYLIDRGMLDPDIVYYEGRIDNPFVKVQPKLVHPAQTRIAELKQKQPSYDPPASKEQGLKQPQPKSIRCVSCGAPNRILKGQSKSCEYCGTTISSRG